MYQNTPCGLILEQDAKLNSVKTFKAQYPGGLTERFYRAPVQSIRQQPHHTSSIFLDPSGFVQSPEKPVATIGLKFKEFLHP